LPPQASVNFLNRLLVKAILLSVLLLYMTIVLYKIKKMAVAYWGQLAKPFLDSLRWVKSGTCLLIFFPFPMEIAA